MNAQLDRIEKMLKELVVDLRQRRVSALDHSYGESMRESEMSSEQRQRAEEVYCRERSHILMGD